MTQEDLEAVIFDEIGGHPYQLKKITNLHPQMNLNGCFKINGDYYYKVYLKDSEMGYRSLRQSGIDD